MLFSQYELPELSFSVSIPAVLSPSFLHQLVCKILVLHSHVEYLRERADRFTIDRRAGGIFNYGSHLEEQVSARAVHLLKVTRLRRLITALFVPCLCGLLSVRICVTGAF